MATVTGLTADRMMAIEASSVVGGSINGSGHLILTKHDGSTIDAGNALVAVPSEDLVHYLSPVDYHYDTASINYPDGVSLMWVSDVQVAAYWPAFSGKWGSIVTVNYPARYGDGDTSQTWTRLHGTGVVPEKWIRSGNTTSGWSDWKKLALDDNAVHLLSSLSETSPASSYPFGVSLLTVGTADSWSLNTSQGIVITNRISDTLTEQTFYSNSGGSTFPQSWARTYNTTGGWTSWQIVQMLYTLNPSGFVQTTPFTSYPQGESRIYYTGAASSGWDFVGLYGEIRCG